MKAFLLVLSVILILFGLSIWYYRANPEGGFTFPKLNLFKKQATDQATGTPTPTIGKEVSARNDGGVAPDFGSVLSGNQSGDEIRTVEIIDADKGLLAIGKSRVFFGIGKTKDGGSVSVKGSWQVADSSLGSLSLKDGSEVVMTPLKEGKSKLVLSFGNLRSEREIQIAAQVLGAVVSKPSPTPTPTATKTPFTPSPIPKSSNEVAVAIYDPDAGRISVGDSRNFSAKVLFSDGSQKNLEVNWSLSNGLGTLSRSKGITTDFRALKTGEGELKAEYQGISTLLSLQVN